MPAHSGAVDASLRAIGARYTERCGSGLQAARWSAGALVAAWAFRSVEATGTGHVVVRGDTLTRIATAETGNPRRAAELFALNRGVRQPDGGALVDPDRLRVGWVIRLPGGDGLFASLNEDARDTLACLAVVPPVLPLCLLLLSVVWVYGSFASVVRDVTVHPVERPAWIDPRRADGIHRGTAALPLGWRTWVRWGWWSIALAAGATSVAVLGVSLAAPWPDWVGWTVGTTVAWTILRIENRSTTARYEPDPPAPTPSQVSTRRAEWDRKHPGQASTGMPLLYAHSGLDIEQIQAQFRELGRTGALGATMRLLGFVAMIAVCAMLPTLSVDRFRSDGLTGCLYVNLIGVAGVAKENLTLTLTATAIMVALAPVWFLEANRRFMTRRRFPRDVQAEVLRREAPAAAAYWGVALGLAIVVGVPYALLFWLSAVVATEVGSAAAGLTVLLLIIPAGMAATYALRAIARSRT